MRVYPHPAYQRFPGMKLLFQSGLPSSWLVTDSLVLRTEYDFQKMTQQDSLRKMVSIDEEAVSIGVERGIFKTMGEEDELGVVVCTASHGAIWYLDSWVRPGREVFVNSNVELFEEFLKLHDTLRTSSEQKTLYRSVRKTMLAAEPSLHWRTASKTRWRQFLDECDVDYDWDEEPSTERSQ